MGKLGKIKDKNQKTNGTIIAKRYINARIKCFRANMGKWKKEWAQF